MTWQTRITYERATGKLAIDPGATREDLEAALMAMAQEFYREHWWPLQMRQLLEGEKP